MNDVQIYFLLKHSKILKEFHYLGHLISGEVITMDSSKIEAIMDWPTPRNVYEVCSFMVLVGYYRRFIEGFFNIIPSPISSGRENNSSGRMNVS
jgi:hypothetical protein